MTEAGKIVAAVRIDDGEGCRQGFVRLMVIDDDDIDVQRARLRQRLDAGGAAIDRHQQRRASRGERSHCFDIRSISFEQPIRNVDQRFDAGTTEKARQQRRRGGTVDIIIAKDRHRLAAHDGVGNSAGRLLHAGEYVRIGHRAFDRRIEERLDRVHLNVAAGENAREQLRNVVTLRNGERAGRPARVEPVAPRPAGRRLFDAEKKIAIHWRNVTRLESHPVRLADSSPGQMC